MKKVLSSPLSKAGVALVAVLAMVWPASAFAADYTATQATTDGTAWVATLAGAMAPFIIAIATGLIGLFLLTWAVRTVFRKVRAYAHF